MTDSMVDLRSDTVTLPTDEMREAMKQAVVGDSMRGEDPTMNELEALAADRMGKQAAIFVSSGTMGNLVCLMAHTQHGDEVILEADAHSYYYEVGSFASIAGLSPRLVHGHHGVMDPDDLRAAIRPPSPFFPRRRLLCLENTHNRCGGNAIRLEEMAAMTAIAREHGLAVHLDGARIFNAAVALGVRASDIARHVDSVQFCLSKGLSAPVGSLVTGSSEFIERAKRVRKSLGGDMRQSGVLAAAGIVALKTMVERLAEDHRHAARLAEGLKKIEGLVLDEPPVPTNMIFIELGVLGMSEVEFVSQLKARGVLAVAYGRGRVRMVTHRHIDATGVDRAVQATQDLVSDYRRSR